MIYTHTYMYICVYILGSSDQARASRAQRLTELYDGMIYGTMLRNYIKGYITGYHYRIILRDHITRYYYGIILRNHTMGRDYGIILRDSITG